jgi:DNA-binding beta-propeller fold protein YncE
MNRAYFAVSAVLLVTLLVLLGTFYRGRQQPPVEPGKNPGIELLGELNAPDEYAFINPLDVTADLDGFVYVADAGSHEIKVFSPRGELAYVLGGRGFFNYPNAVAAGPGNLLYIGEFREKRIQVIDTQVREVVAVINEETLGEPVEPLSLAAAADGTLYVGDRRGAVLVITQDGTLQQKINQVAADPDRLSFPNGVAVDLDGNVIVADSGNSRLLRINGEGETEGIFSNKALHHPRGVGFVGDKYLVVADAFGSQILLLDREFAVQSVLQNPAGSKIMPNRVGLSGSTLYVADRGGSRVLMFGIRE